jgi:hypothetical protein
MGEVDNLSILYNIVSPKIDLGEYEDFKKKMEDPANRAAFYRQTKQYFDLGTYDEFSSRIVKKKGVSVSPSLGTESTATSPEIKQPPLLSEFIKDKTRLQGNITRSMDFGLPTKPDRTVFQTKRKSIIDDTVIEPIKRAMAPAPFSDDVLQEFSNLTQQADAEIYQQPESYQEAQKEAGVKYTQEVKIPRAKQAERVSYYKGKINESKKAIGDMMIPLISKERDNAFNSDKSISEIITERRADNKKIKSLLSATKSLDEMQSKIESIGTSGVKNAAGFKLRNFEDIATLGWSKVAGQYNIKKIADKYFKGDVISPEEEMALVMYGLNQEVAKNIETPIGYDIADGLIEMVPYMAQFALTGGIASATEGAVMKGLSASAEKTAMNFMKKGAAYAIGSAARASTFAMAPERYLSGQTGSVNVTENGIMIGREETKTESLLKAAGTTYSEVVTEGLLSKLGGKKVADNAIRKIATEAGWKDIPSEFTEEMINSGISGAIEGQDMKEVYSPRNILTTLAVTSIAGGGIQASEYLSGKIQYKNKNTQMMNESASGVDSGTKKKIDDAIDKSLTADEISEKLELIIDSGIKDDKWNKDKFLNVTQYITTKIADKTSNDIITENKVREDIKQVKKEEPELFTGIEKRRNIDLDNKKEQNLKTATKRFTPEYLDTPKGKAFKKKFNAEYEQTYKSDIDAINEKYDQEIAEVAKQTTSPKSEVDAQPEKIVEKTPPMEVKIGNAILKGEDLDEYNSLVNKYGKKTADEMIIPLLGENPEAEPWSDKSAMEASERITQQKKEPTVQTTPLTDQELSSMYTKDTVFRGKVNERAKEQGREYANTEDKRFIYEQQKQGNVQTEETTGSASVEEVRIDNEQGSEEANLGNPAKERTGGEGEVTPTKKTRKQAAAKQRNVRKLFDVIEKVKKSFPNIDIITDVNQMPEDIRKLAGAERGGKVYINPELATTETAIHEPTHLWTKIALETDPSLIRRVKKEAKETDIYKELEKNPEYKNLNEDELVQETISVITGIQGQARAESKGAKRIGIAIEDSVNKLGRKLGFSVDINKMDINKLADLISREIASGRPITQDSSIDLDNVFNKKPGAKLTLSDTVLNDPRNTFANKRIKPFFDKMMDTQRGNSLANRDAVELMKNKIKAVGTRYNLLHQHLFDNLVKDYAKKNGKEMGEQLVRDIGDVFSGTKMISEIPQEIVPTLTEVLNLKRVFVDANKKALELKGDVIGALNEDLQLFLTDNFTAQDDYNSIEKELADKHKKEAIDLRKTKDAELESKAEEIKTKLIAQRERRQVLKLKGIEGKITNVQTIREDENALTGKLLKELDRAKKRLEQIDSETLSGSIAVEQTEKGKELTKQIRDTNKLLSDLLSSPQTMTPKQLAIAEEIESTNASIAELMQEYEPGITRDGVGKMLDSYQSLEFSNNKLEYDLGLVDFIQYSENDNDSYDITFNHRDGHSHKVDDISRDDMYKLFGQTAVGTMEGTGIHNFAVPQLLLNNYLYEKIKKNDMSYVNRSYMMHDIKDFAVKVKKYVGEDVYHKAETFLRDRYQDPRIVGVKKIKTAEGSTEYIFNNIYGVESVPMSSNDINKFLETIGISEKDINNFKRQRFEEVYRLQKPTSLWRPTGVNFHLPAHRMQSMIGDILDVNNFDNIFSNKPISEGVKIDSGILKKKKDIAPEIRGLMGEYLDPRVNIAKTMLKAGMKAAHDELHYDFLQRGVVDGIITDKNNRGAEHSQKITEADSQVMAGYYTTKPMYDFLFDKDGFFNNNKAMMMINGLVKMNFTVLSGGSQTRNAWGAMFNLWAATGDPTVFKNINKAFLAASQEFHGAEGIATYLSSPMFMLKLANGGRFGNKGDKSLRELFIEGQEEGIFGSNVEGAATREMTEILEEINPKNIFGKAVKAGGKIIGAASKTYQLSDNTMKFSQYLMEKADYIKAGFSEAEARTKAGNIVKNTQPHYNRAPRIFKWLSRNPIIGPFVMFKAEMYRTRYEIIKLAYDEVNSKNKVLAKKGMLRIAGLLSGQAMVMGLRYAAMAMLGLTDDEDKAVRDMHPEYSRNNGFIYLDSDLRNPLYLDFTWIEPGSMFTNTAIALISGRPSVVSEVRRELLGDFISPEIFVNSVYQVLNNETDYGAPIYKEAENKWRNMVDIGAHLSRVLVPGEVKSASRILESMIDPEQKYYTLNTRDEVMNRVLGIKIKQRDITRNYGSRTTEEMDGLYSARSIYVDNPNEKTLERSRKAIEDSFRDMTTLYKDMELLGFTQEEIAEYGNLPNYIIDDIQQGYLSEENYFTEKNIERAEGNKK